MIIMCLYIEEIPFLLKKVYFFWGGLFEDNFQIWNLKFFGGGIIPGGGLFLGIRYIG